MPAKLTTVTRTARSLLKLWLGAIVALGVTIVIAPMAGANGVTNYYVDVDGSGSACTATAPCASIFTALNDASNSGLGVVNVGPGTFTDGGFVPPGTYTISGVPGSTILQGGGDFTQGLVNEGATVTVSGITFSHYADDVANLSGTMTLDSDTFMHAGTGIEADSTTAISNSTITKDGVGLENEGGTVSVTSSTFSDSGDAIEAESGTTTITNATIESVDDAVDVEATVSVAESTLANDGTAFNFTAGTLTVGSSIIDDDDTDCTAAVTNDNGYNVDSDGANGCEFESYFGDLTDTDAQVGALQDNGGPTETAAILSTSPAYDIVPAAQCTATDQRGASRLLAANENYCDAGAYQWAAPASISFSTGPMTGVASTSPNVGPITVDVEDAAGFPAVSPSAITLDLSTTAPNGFFGTDAGGSTTDAVTVPIGQTYTSFYVGSTTPVSFAATVDGGDLGTLNQTETITTAAPAAVGPAGGYAQTATVGTNFADPLVLNVQDALGNPIVGASVTFTVSSDATFPDDQTTATVTTDAAGDATSPTLTAGTSPSVIAVYATVAGTAFDEPFPEYIVTGPAASISLVAGTPQYQEPEDEFVTPLTAQVVDQYGNPVDDATVSFVVDNGDATLGDASATTDGSGNAADDLYAQSEAGPVTVTATVEGTSITTTADDLAVVPGPAVYISDVIGDGQSATPTAEFSTELQVQVLDNYGNAVAPTQVDFEVLSGSATLSSLSATTNALGQASVTLQAGETAGPVTVEAWVDGMPWLETTFSETVIPGSPDQISINGGDDQTTTPTASFSDPLSVTVEDAYGNAVPDTQVDFAVVSGSAELSATADTDGNGNASDDLTAGTLAGPVNVQATVDADPSLSETFSETVEPGDPAALTIVSGDDQSTTPTAGFGTALGVELVDSWGNPVADTQIDYAIATGTGELTSATENTNDNGVAQDGLSGSTVSGPLTVTATDDDDDSLNVTFTESVVPGPADSIIVTGGSGQSVLSGSWFPTALSVLVTDAWGNDITGDTVVFSVTSGSANFAGPSSTNAPTIDGVATTHLRAGNAAGTETVTATVLGTSVTTDFSGLTITPPHLSYTVSNFGVGSSTLGASQKAAVVSAAKQIQKYAETTVSIDGYADDTGSAAGNQTLSLNRAKAVRTALEAELAHLGVHGVTITVTGKGATNFVAGVPHDSGANRRAVLAIS